MKEYALAEDRERALEQFIVGTEDYYYFHCLHYQHTGRLDEAEDQIKLWVQRHGRSSRTREIVNRQALLRYDAQPDDTLKYLRKRLKVRCNHQRELEGESATYPNALDAEKISRETLKRRAFSQDSNLTGFSSSAHEWLVGEELEPDVRRELLGRLERPDYDELVDLICFDLDHEYSGDFGSLTIHKRLLKEQLDELVNRRPDLLSNSDFVNTYLRRLRPTSEIDWEHDWDETERYLGRLWEFVAPLASAFNSLKALILYHQLDNARAKGEVERECFLQHIKLPRQAWYMDPDYLGRSEHYGVEASLGADYRDVTGLGPIQDDERLVRDCLMSFFLTDEDFETFKAFIRDDYLRDVFATTKLLNGIGDMEKWVSLLDDPAKYQALQERVDIEFAPTNKPAFRGNEAVTLDVDIKNVSTLVVKVFEINTLNYYLKNGKELSTAIDLDGLVAGEETTYTYEESPLSRVRRTFSFPSLSAPGVYIIDFIGNGKSSRALVRKGQLRYLERIGAAGHVFRLLDEENQPLSDATLWLSGREYYPRDDGAIVVPFSTNPGHQPILLCQGTLTTLDSFYHQAERFDFRAGIYIDRESLINGQRAQVVVRSGLYLCGFPVSLALVEEPRLSIESTDRHDVQSQVEVNDFELFNDRESTFTFKVPEDLTHLNISVSGRIRPTTGNKRIEVSATHSVSLNQIDSTDKTEDLHLSQTNTGYVLYVLGKTGEARSNALVNVSVAHRDFTQRVDVTLKTDQRGRIVMGPLADITDFRASLPDGAEERWSLSDDDCVYGRSIHAGETDTIRIPYVGTPAGPSRSSFSLLEKRSGVFAHDCFAAVSLNNGFVEVSGLKAGDYDFWLKEQNTHIQLCVTAGSSEGNWLVSNTRVLERRDLNPLQIARIEEDDTNLDVWLANTSTHTRVHIIGTRFTPQASVFRQLSAIGPPGLRQINLSKELSDYVSGRDIGDEYRYVLERKYAKKYPGNMLSRPGLLLNPWAVRGTDTGIDDAVGGAGFDGRKRSAKRKRERRAEAEPKPTWRAGAFSNLDFLAQPSTVLLNQQPDQQGRVRVPLSALGNVSQIRVVAIDPYNTVARTVALPEVTEPHRDLRLRRGLDPEQHFTEQKQVSPLPTSTSSLELEDITTSKIEIHDSLARVFSLFSTLTSNATLSEFSFIIDWPTLSQTDKRKRYSEYACHELNLFLWKKDPDFFAGVVKPYLRNKKDKTFVDRFLLDDDLTEYLKPWKHSRLNIVERILLSKRLKQEREPTLRHVSDLVGLIPPDIEGDNHLFQTALHGSALETTDTLGFDSALEEAEECDEPPAFASKAGDFPPPPACPAPAAEKMSAPPGRPLSDLAGFAEMDADDDFDMKDREQTPQYYQKLEKTKEWAENNYYHRTIDEQGPELVAVNAFWRDFAEHQGSSPFLSRHIAKASRNFTEMILALAVVDLPFVADKHTIDYEGTRMTVKAGSPAIVFHKEIKPATPSAEKTPLLVSQNYFRADDRYRYEGSERFDKYVTEEFLVATAYLCQVVLTNPTSAPQKLDLLLQIPRGALPVQDGFFTRGVHLRLNAFGTQSLEYQFYFPASGEFFHYPVHVSKNEELIAAASPTTLKVVQRLSKVDETSWGYLSQRGEPQQIVRFLRDNNIERVTLEKIAWRMKDRDFYEQIVTLLTERHVYDHALWSYSLLHNDAPNIGEYLQHEDSFLRQCGLFIESTLVSLDPVVRGTYEHLEYAPLVNARAHQLRGRHKILNNRFSEQWERFLAVLNYKPQLSSDDLVAVATYLLLQDRVDDAMEVFERVDSKQVTTALQYDYLRSVLDFFSDHPGRAREWAAQYETYPVDRWCKLFCNVLRQLDEVDNPIEKPVDEADRTGRQTHLASKQPSFDLTVENNVVTVTYQNLAQCQVNTYLMDIELLFSRQPFVQQQSDQFTFIKPKHSCVLDLPEDGNQLAFDLPERFKGANVIVEIVAEGQRRAKAYYAHSLLVQLVENYGQVRVSHRKTAQPLPKTYVKTYARMQGGEVRFYKDGYTDLRGAFDFTSLSTDELDRVERFALLILSEEHGAVIREAAPPKR